MTPSRSAVGDAGMQQDRARSAIPVSVIDQHPVAARPQLIGEIVEAPSAVAGTGYQHVGRHARTLSACVSIAVLAGHPRQVLGLIVVAPVTCISRLACTDVRGLGSTDVLVGSQRRRRSHAASSSASTRASTIACEPPVGANGITDDGGTPQQRYPSAPGHGQHVERIDRSGSNDEAECGAPDPAASRKTAIPFLEVPQAAERVARPATSRHAVACGPGRGRASPCTRRAWGAGPRIAFEAAPRMALSPTWPSAAEVAHRAPRR